MLNDFIQLRNIPDEKKNDVNFLTTFFDSNLFDELGTFIIFLKF